MLSVAGADHIITMDLHASQIQVGLHPTFYFLTVLVEDLSVLCVASTLTFDLGCRRCLGSVQVLCVVIVQGGGRGWTLHTVKIAVHSAMG